MNPECTHPAHPEPEGWSEGFCCEKCEGRFNGEEWAMPDPTKPNKKLHTAYCTSNEWKSGKKSVARWQPCKNPECQHPAHPNPEGAWSPGFCCEKCEGRFNGEEWAMAAVGTNKKMHTALCTSRSKVEWQVESTQRGAQAGGAQAVASRQELLAQQLSQHFTKDQALELLLKLGGQVSGSSAGSSAVAGPGARSKGAGKFTGAGGCTPAGAKNLFDVPKGGKGKAKGKEGKSRPPALHDFPSELKVFVVGLPASADRNTVLSHCKQAGDVKLVTVKKDGEAGVVFETAEDAANAVILLNGSLIDDNVVEVGMWAEKYGL